MTLARFSWRQLWKGAVIWAAVIAVVVLTGIRTFDSVYPDELSRQVFAQSLGRLPAFQALYGQAVGVDTAGGFLTWRYGDIMTVIVSLWALLTVTRMMRGDEESQRAEVLVSGRVSPRRLMAVQLAMVAAGCVLVLVVAALACMAGGLAVGGSVLFGTMVAAGGVVFGALAAFTSQLFDARRRAAGWAGAVLGASYLLRALADGSSHLHWLGWFTPLGWTERIAPFTGSSAGPIVLVVVASAAMGGLAVFVRDRRDTGAGLIAERTGEDRTRSIRSTAALDWYLSTGALMAWSVGVLIELFVLGYLTHDMVRFAAENPAIDELMIKIYGYSMGSPVGFMSVSFTVVAMVLAVYAGTHMLSAREEEAAGRADNMLVAGTSRERWLASRLAIALGAMAVLAVVAAIGAWAGVNLSGSSLSLTDALAASINVVPTALLFGGLSVLAFGAVPRATAYVAFGAVTIAFLVQLVGGLSAAPGWLMNLSPFSHIAPVPATSMNVTSTVVALAVAVVSTGLGVLAFGRRDLATD